jgi:hypothetical protein
MATDTGRGSRKGAVRQRSQRQTKMMGQKRWTSAAEQAANSCHKRSPAPRDTKATARAGLTRQLSDGKSYRVVGNTGHWAVAEDGAEPAGDYATEKVRLK